MDERSRFMHIYLFPNISLRTRTEGFQRMVSVVEKPTTPMPGLKKNTIGMGEKINGGCGGRPPMAVRRTYVVSRGPGAQGTEVN